MVEEEKAIGNSLVNWSFIEERSSYGKKKEQLIIASGIAVVVIAIFIMKSYFFATLIAIATFVFIFIYRKGGGSMPFKITENGICIGKDFIENENIQEFNIIDDDGEYARLILKIKKIVGLNTNEIVPIYDTNIKDIKNALSQIKENKKLEPTFIDELAKLI